MLKLKFRSSV